ncbi:hypothetical protein O3P69_010398 [Scylla paramamosain]|uniref:Uncharacterized protein n=1 Tax=Scylla paramamosain TaxID=85552 RepID=A0AAW0TSY4_SCYPA
MNIGAPCRQSGLYAFWAAMGSPEEERRCVKLTRFKKMSSTPELDKYDDEGEDGSEAEEAGVASEEEEEEMPPEVPADEGDTVPKVTVATPPKPTYVATPPKPTYADKVKGVRSVAAGTTCAVLARTVENSKAAGRRGSEQSEAPARQAPAQAASEADETEESPPEFLSCGDQDSLHLSDVEDTHNSFTSTPTSSTSSTSSSPAPLDISDVLRISEDVLAQSPGKTLRLLQVGGRCPAPARHLPNPRPHAWHTWRAAARWWRWRWRRRGREHVGMGEVCCLQLTTHTTITLREQEPARDPPQTPLSRQLTGHGCLGDLGACLGCQAKEVQLVIGAPRTLAVGKEKEEEEEEEEEGKEKDA